MGLESTERVGFTRLDNKENKSDACDWLDVQVRQAKVRASKNLAWLEHHQLVDKSTGEIHDGSLLDVSRSWYSPQGAHNSSKLVSKRLSRVMSSLPGDGKHRPKFITLTFATVADSWQVEKAITRFLDRLRHWAKRRGEDVAYFWSGELQKRDALHYHVAVFGLSYVPKSQLKLWWPHGFSDVRAFDDVGRICKYIFKYLWKWSKIVADAPDLASLPDAWFYFAIWPHRRYGFSNFFQLPASARVPAHVRQSAQELQLEIVGARPATGGGWDVRMLIEGIECHAFYPSRFVVVENSS